MFVDLVGSTALSKQLDPEETREVICSHQDAVAGAVARFDGHIAKFMGDGVLVCFGWPQAHEDDAERAVRAGLAVAAAVSRLATPRAEPLAARIGVATGLVVVGDLVSDRATEEIAVVGEKRADRALRLAEEQGFAMVAGISGVMRGAARNALAPGRPGGGGHGAVTEIQGALVQYRRTGAVVQVPHLMTLLAEAHLRAGASDQGLAALSQASDLIERSGERYFEAEVWRVRGELLRSCGRDGDAEASFRKAIDVARAQEARSFELRAATSCARLCCDQRRQTEACDLLAPVYDWFSEGFDTLDMKEARALLEELSYIPLKSRSRPQGIPSARDLREG